ncbi:hypothetical protein B0H15DRAFT_857661 [Mycena belliarum]|uniref:RING-CH-type domain-containing protein n=1 Tax=Mycena belliarum TaxID=1033014 RepID=A0AAD6TYR0_9AGAR|nr:hypothetical protein B0H15DRAFT_857661 [Mycena belliae]
MSDRPPTLADLRVKLCYICRDEEKDGPNPPRAWVHPCSCTLVAHESCLLEWIKSSEGTGREASARHCPQCKTQYELESKNPTVLRILRIIDKNLARVDFAFYVAGFYLVLRAVYRAHLGYGAWALRKYIGDEVFDLLFSDDRSNWPLIAKFNIVLIPAGLVLSRLGLHYTISALLATWPTFASFTFSHDAIAELEDPALDVAQPAGLPWPPSPFLFGFVLLPICRSLYSHYFAKFRHWVLDTQPVPPRVRTNPGIRGFLQRFLDDMERAADARAAAVNAGNANANANAGAGGGAAGANDDGAIVTVDLRRAGRVFGGALLVPLISNVMGDLLHRLSKHFDLLKRFLAVRPPWTGFLPPPPLRRYTAKEIWQRASGSEPQDAGRTLKFVLRAVWGDIRKLDQCDPVWWRNSIGLGLFVVAKDFLHLLYLWLAQRELATRRVKSRDFSGVDPRELDLLPRALPPMLRPGTTLPGTF